MINSLDSLNFLQLPITKKGPIIKTDYKKKKNKQTLSTDLHQTTPKEKHLLKPAAGDIVHKQWNMINKICHHGQERYSTRPVEAYLSRKAAGG